MVDAAAALPEVVESTACSNSMTKELAKVWST
jgi:hypothetical protein